MRAKFWLFPAVSLLVLGTLVYSTQAQAQEDVLVDFSVLDSLIGGNQQSYSDGPLFPEVKPTIKKAKTAKIAPKKAQIKVKKTQKSVKKIAIPAKKDVEVEVTVKETLSNSNSGLSAADLKDSPFAMAPAPVAVDEIIPAPIAPVEIKTEPLVNVEPAVTMEPLNGSTTLPKSSEEAVSSNGENESRINYMQESVSPVVTPSETSIPSMSNTTSQPTIEAVPSYLQEPLNTNVPEDISSVAADTSPAAPLVPAVLDVSEKAPVMLSTEILGEVFFAEGSSELTDDNKQQLDNLLASFEDAHNNKIAIYAFNIDNGKDVFSKKRLSLNRAIEIRSYFLSKGYKNFSIKVVNTNEDNAKENRVVVEELK